MTSARALQIDNLFNPEHEDFIGLLIDDYLNIPQKISNTRW